MRIKRIEPLCESDACAGRRIIVAVAVREGARERPLPVSRRVLVGDVPTAAGLGFAFRN